MRLAFPILARLLIMLAVSLPHLGAMNGTYEALIILALLVAYTALKLYDEPAREWLKEKWLKDGRK